MDPQAHPARPVMATMRPGDLASKVPFTVAIVANPSLESPWGSGNFVVDPITSDQGAFDGAARYVEACLFGKLQEQRENLLADPQIGHRVRVMSLFVGPLPANASNSLAAEDGVSDLLVARREAFVPFLARYDILADVAYAVSMSTARRRASAWWSTDDDTRPGVPFTLNGATLHHRHFSQVPGTVALHASSTSLVALHEFTHAISSDTNGFISDLYVDGSQGANQGINKEYGRPIPTSFGVYGSLTLATDPTRGGLGYPTTWRSYHCELLQPGFPAVMDDFWLAPDSVPEHCVHDRITRQFLKDRLLAKLAR